MNDSVLIGLLLSLILPVAPNAKAAEVKPKAKKFVVDIDNPSFRKLAMAIPVFQTDAKSSSGVKEQAGQGAKELARLLTFSGLFAVVEEAAYSGVLDKPKKSKIGMVEGLDLAAWKALGIEGVTTATLTEAKEGLQLEIKTIDINRGELILGKRYSRIKPEEYNAVIRRYADQVLMAYTGKPGIFSSKIVFVGRRNRNDQKQVYVCDFDGSNVRQITKKNTTHLSPNWSRDGRYLSFTSYEDGNPDLFTYELATGKKKKVSGHKGLNSGGSWSPNGKLLVFTGSLRGDADIYWVPSSGGGRRALIRGSGLEVDPTISPNNEWLAFVSGRYGNPHIFVGKLKWTGDTRVEVVSEKRLTYQGWYNSTPDWSPDSKVIVFAGYDKEIDRYDVFTIDPNNIKKIERLTLKSGDNENPSWSPNGQMIVFQSDRTKGRDVKGKKKLFVMNRDGGSQRVIDTGLYESQTPVWGPPLP